MINTFNYHVWSQLEEENWIGYAELKKQLMEQYNYIPGDITLKKLKTAIRELKDEGAVIFDHLTDNDGKLSGSGYFRNNLDCGELNKYAQHFVSTLLPREASQSTDRVNGCECHEHLAFPCKVSNKQLCKYSSVNGFGVCAFQMIDGKYCFNDKAREEARLNSKIDERVFHER